ncbi:MAG: thioredoxin family protein [Desulfovibrio sp.]|jgi:thiol:disulfide interchange protein DsbD|nr:thioredoxin family protein [Desulfovibrio sp.]
MRLFWSLLFFLITAAGPLAGSAHAFPGANCVIYWKAYTLDAAPGPGQEGVPGFYDLSADKAGGKRLLLALTLAPPEGEYLYGVETTDGLPTTVEAFFAPLSAFPMQPMSAADINQLMESRGHALPVRAPSAPLKKDTAFASISLPGSEEGNPPIFPGPVTFWTELPFAQGLGGVAAKVTMSGLLCSATSCTPVSGTLELAFSALEMASFPPAKAEAWWTAWTEGESVLIPPPEGTVEAALSPGIDPFAGGRRLTPPAAPESEAEKLARHAAVFSTLAPAFFNPEVEVRFLGEALLFGLLAGLILNLMPCVLPVVSLKFSALMAVTSMEDKKRQAGAFRVHCLIFALGIMTWFLVLAVMLGVAGWAWGELFQRPIVIVLLGLMLFLLALSLFGVFSLPIFDPKITRNGHPYWQAFASGLLATLLATPCSGPLLGGVLAWAILQPLPVLILTIASVGVGMSAPYGVMAFCPGLVRLLPRPGAWTLRLEQLLAFFLMASVVYLATLLPDEWIPAFLFSLFAVAFAAWLWGQIGHLRAGRLRRFISRAVAIGVLLLAAAAGVASVNPDRTWEKFEPEVFTKLLGKEPMLLDFTADWCPSCKALEHTTLSRGRMADLRRRYNVRTIRVDLTRNAEAGQELLKALNSTSIPVLALFPEGTLATRPVVLRDLVTPKQLEEAASAAFAGKNLETFRRLLSENGPRDLNGPFTYWGESCPIFPSLLPR